MKGFLNMMPHCRFLLPLLLLPLLSGCGAMREYFNESSARPADAAEPKTPKTFEDQLSDQEQQLLNDYFQQRDQQRLDTRKRIFGY